MSNSPLVNYTKISPNKSSPRNHKIDTVTIHCVVGQCSVETLGNVFAPTSRQASSNYGIGYDGRIGMYVEEKDRSWCSSNAANDNRAITIEVASDTKEPYAVTGEGLRRAHRPARRYLQAQRYQGAQVEGRQVSYRSAGQAEHDRAPVVCE